MLENNLATGTARPSEENRKFPCKQCGAGLNFKPGATALECPYCGYREPINVAAEEIREYDLEDALLRLPPTQGWGSGRQAMRCDNCGAVTTFEPGQVAGACAFCGSSRVSTSGSNANLIRPESLVAFKVDRSRAGQLFRDWVKGLWFRPNDLKHAAQVSKITGAYLPFWSYDALTVAHWNAEAGWHYYVTETYEDTDSEGNRVTRQRQVQHTRWEWVQGGRQDLFDDELVCGSKGLPEKLISGACPYNLDELMPYDAGFLSGFAAEEYQIDLSEGWDRARERMEGAVYSRCAADVPGDTHRALQVHTAFSNMTFKHLLLPVWIAAYLYRDKSYRFLVNGQTGRISGEAPISWWKVAGAVLAVAIVVLLIVFLRDR